MWFGQQGYVNTERGSVENLAIAETEARITSLEPQLATKNQQTDHLHHLLAQSPLNTALVAILAGTN